MDACSKALNRILVRREGRKLRWMGVMQESKNVSFWGMIVSAFIRNYLPSRATPLGDDLKNFDNSGTIEKEAFHQVVAAICKVVENQLNHCGV